MSAILLVWLVCT